MQPRKAALIVGALLWACGDATGPFVTGAAQSLAAGGNHTCALTKDGATYCWGAGDLGNGLARFDSMPVAVVGGLVFQSLASARDGLHVCGVTTAGAAYCWGDNRTGQLGDGSTTSSATPVAVSGGITFASLAAGQWHTCGVTPAGSAYCWGWNSNGQIGDGTFGSSIRRLTPVPVLGGIIFTSLTASGDGTHVTCGLSTAGAAYCWGSNAYGQIGDGTLQSRYVPTAVVGGITFASLAAGGTHLCGLTAGGSAHCWGRGDLNQMGNGSQVFRNMAPVAVAGGLSFGSLTAAGNHTCALTLEGAEYCWGDNNQTPTAIPGGITYASLATSTGHTCGLTPDGTAYCQGPNDDGRLGDGSTITRLTAVPVAGNVRFKSLATGGASSILGSSFSCGVTNAGAAYCWGSKVYGAVGTGTIPPVGQPAPVAVAGGTRFASLVAGGSHSCGLTDTGAVYCWGDGRTTPVAVAGGFAFKNLAAGGNRTCGVDNVGAAYCWGASSSTPVAVPGGITFESLVVDKWHACGLTSAGAAYCWGYQCVLGLGDFQTPNDATPVEVPGGITFRSLTAGGESVLCHTCGVSGTGDAYCWGTNLYGEVGDGSTNARTNPVAVAGGRTWQVVSTGAEHTCGLTTGGAAYCWGNNNAGQLGDGTGTQRTAPVPVKGGIKFATLTAGDTHTCGMTGGGAAYCWGDNSLGQLGDGTKDSSPRPVRVLTP